MSDYEEAFFDPSMSGDQTGQESVSDQDVPKVEGVEEAKPVSAEEEVQVTEQKEQKKNIPGSQREKARRMALEAELASMRAEISALKSPQQQKKGDDPSLSDFDSVEEYLDAREAAREAKKAQQQQAKEWEARESEARSSMEDYDETFQDFVSLRPSKDVVEAVIESPVGPAIAYYLGSNPDESKRISALSPKRQVIEIGKIELKIMEPERKAVAPVKKTQAPPPITPVRASSGIVPVSPKGYKLY